ncbi:YodL domain-containing protein [Bengtsoniella intestinalis]|uniref:YodL domain-containing protein n=1 Tax=Bengtsoniella intestinalis TaxID=3073143 RepID=UPI00391F0507
MEQDMVLKLTPEEKRKQEELESHATYQVGDGYFMIEEHTEGWNYNFYDRNMVVTDGGVYDDPDISIGDAIDSILEAEVFIGKDSLLDRTATMIDFDAFCEEVDSCEQEHTASQLKDFQFENTQDASYAIYQLKTSDYTRDFRFEGATHLERNNIAIEKGNFNNVYTAPLDEETKGLSTDSKLNKLYTQFNIDHPQDFTGHSLSVGDVVALKEDGKISYHFVDSFGFKEIPFENVVEQLHGVDTQTHLTELVGIAKSNPQDLVQVLSNDRFARDELATAISICNLQEELEGNFSFEDVAKLNSYCRDVWLKVDEVSFEKVKDFATAAINENTATIDEILSMTRSEFGSAVIDNDTHVLSELFPKESNEQLITPDSDHIKVDGHIGTWYVVDTTKIDHETYHLLEHETYGDEAACIIVNGSGMLVLDDVWNGFDDLHDHLADLQAEKSKQHENPLETVEKSVEQNYNQIDGLINNQDPTDILKELEDAREEVKAEKAQAPKVDDPERKPSVLQKLREGKAKTGQDITNKEKSKEPER